MKTIAFIALQIGLFISTCSLFQQHSGCKIFAISKCVDTVPRVLHHEFYTIHFDSAEHGPDYTEYWLTKAHLKHVCPRPVAFTTDPLICTKCQGSNADYRNSGFDKGHLSPADDFRFNIKAEDESMYLTNVAYQNPYFNEHLWKAVEDHVRDLATQYDSVYVVTGVLYGDNKLHGVGIPDYYWKVVTFSGNTEYFLGVNMKPKSNDWKSIEVDKKTFDETTNFYK